MCTDDDSHSALVDWQVIMFEEGGDHRVESEEDEGENDEDGVYTLALLLLTFSEHCYVWKMEIN